jgi:hypothetical protein
VLIARGPELFLVLIFGIIAGIYAIIEGVKSIRDRHIALTRRKSLAGKKAQIVGLVFMILGFGLILISCYGWTLMPQ